MMASLSRAISFTITACRRPELLDRTLNSFSRGIIDADLAEFQAFINIDPVPEPGCSEDVATVAGGYFHEVRCRMPEMSNFCAAVKWTWSQPDTEYFFHLEDDWELIKPLRLSDLLRVLNQRRYVPFYRARAAVNLNVHGFDDERICLSPGLIRASFGRHAARYLDERYNPERQFRTQNAEECPTLPDLDRFRGFFFGASQKVQYCRDIGRDWRARNGLKRWPDDPYRFNSWQQE